MFRTKNSQDKEILRAVLQAVNAQGLNKSNILYYAYKAIHYYSTASYNPCACCFINSRRNTNSDGPQNAEKDPENLTLTVENVSSKKYSLAVAYLQYLYQYVSQFSNKTSNLLPIYSNIV